MFSRLTALTLALLITSAFSLSCTKRKGSASDPTVPPVAYCPYLPSLSFSSSVTITGMAQYQYRQNGSGAFATLPIRYAEIMVKNSSGTIIQCAETLNDGTFSFALPSNTGNYTIYVNSRGANNNVKAYVLTNPTANTHYSITASVASTASTSVGTLTASATGTLEGGAFNIFDQILKANEFLRNQVTAANCDLSFTSGSAARTECYNTVFSVAPLVYAYWTKGFNPNSYLGGDSSSGVSFYLRGTNELYILGGIGGDVDFEDCDHFDNSIIIHEYGHFIENAYSSSDSQGGSHAGSETIDPRLGWSEAWANFFQAAVTGDPIYRDTQGNQDCGTGCSGPIIEEDLETPDPLFGYDTDVSDSGLGNFREFSTTRMLWDLIDPHPVSNAGTNDSGETVQSKFAELWTVFAGDSEGFRSSNRRFRNIGAYLKQHDGLSGTPDDWSSAVSNEFLIANETDYATPVLLGGACAATTIQGDASTSADGSFTNSDLFFENDFYAYYHTGGSLKVRVDYTPTVGSNAANLNLIVWKNGYKYGRTSDMAASSRIARPDGNAEQITATLSAGWYIINVMIDPSSASIAPGSPNSYTLKINNQTACANP